jgi:hypothetical protein
MYSSEFGQGRQDKGAVVQTRLALALARPLTDKAMSFRGRRTAAERGDVPSGPRPAKSRLVCLDETMELS